MNHKECQHLLGHLSDYVDGELGQTVCEEIERHLARLPELSRRGGHTSQNRHTLPVARQRSDTGQCRGTALQGAEVRQARRVTAHPCKGRLEPSLGV